MGTLQIIHPNDLLRETGESISHCKLYCPPYAAHGLLRDVLRDSERVVQGPPGPPGLPGIPGQSQWVSSRENVVDVVEYLKCKLMSPLWSKTESLSMPNHLLQIWWRADSTVSEGRCWSSSKLSDISIDLLVSTENLLCC